MSTTLSNFEFTTAEVVDLITHSPNYNITQKDQSKLLLYNILIPSLGSVIIVLNLFVVVSSGLILKKGSQQPRSTYLFLGNVAMCDLLTGIAVIFGQSYPKHIRTQLTCGLQLGLIVSSTITSIYSVALIAIDRYLYIIHGLQYARWIYPMRARLLILFTWIIGMIIGFLPIMGWSGDTQNGRICWFIKLLPPNLIMLTCIMGLIPIVIVTSLYSIILYHAIKKVIQLRRAHGPNNKLRLFMGKAPDNKAEDTPRPSSTSLFRRIFKKPAENIGPSRTKAIKVVVFTTGSFIITWVPYFIAGFIHTQCNPKVTPEKCKNLEVLIASPLAILGFCNSLLNPIIYAWWHNGFRTFVKRHILRKSMDQLYGSSSGTKNSKKTSLTSLSNDRRHEEVIQNIEFDTHM